MAIRVDFRNLLIFFVRGLLFLAHPVFVKRNLETTQKTWICYPQTTNLDRINLQTFLFKFLKFYHSFRDKRYCFRYLEDRNNLEQMLWSISGLLLDDFNNVKQNAKILSSVPKINVICIKFLP